MPSLRQSLRRATLVLLVSTLVPATASRADAQELFGNPFLTAEALRLQRGDAPNATLSLRYQVSGDPNAEEARGALVIEVAADWAYVRRSNRQTLYDFRLGRVLDMRDGTFVSRNMVGDVAFRVYERQNRAYLTGVMRSAGGKSPVDGCDAETELGVAIPALKEAADAKVGRSGATTTLECNGRVVGAFETGPENEVPAALWPVLARVMTLHPALHAALMKDGRVPQRVEAAFMLAGARKEPSWRLAAAEPVSVPYPLAAGLTNGTAAWIDKAVAPGLGDLAQAAVAGRAGKGPPTLASWDAEVSRVVKTKGPAAAVFAAWPALNMFPQVGQVCQSGTKSAICASLRGLAATAQADSAVQALLLVARAEQARRPADAVAAMLAARSSPLADHPALGASFALALQGGGQGMAQQAKAAGLPSDAKALHVRALQAYPYVPTYWTDLGDYFTRRYDFFAAYALSDIALSLPMPDAQRFNSVLAGKRQLAARIQGDFPAFFLPR